MGTLGEPRPFAVRIPDGILADLRERLARTAGPTRPPGRARVTGRISVTCATCAGTGEPPSGWAERAFDLRRWTRMPRGGHFAALEAPDLLAEDVRVFFGPLR